MSFTYSLVFTRPDQSTGSVIGGRDTLLATLDGLAADMAFYRNQGYTLLVEFIRQNCDECQGDGYRAHKTNKLRRLPCKACKARGHVQELKPTLIPDASRATRLQSDSGPGPA